MSDINIQEKRVFRFETLQTHARREPESATKTGAVPVYTITSCLLNNTSPAVINLPRGLATFPVDFNRLNTTTGACLQRDKHR